MNRGGMDLVGERQRKGVREVREAKEAEREDQRRVVAWVRGIIS